MSMRGPIIQEHVTDGSIATAGSLPKFYVASEGRALRVYAQGAVTGTGNVTLTVRPVAHFSGAPSAGSPTLSAKQSVAWPVISGTNTDGIVSPDGGDHTQSGSSGNKTFCVMVSGNFSASEYEIGMDCGALTGISNLYIVTELV